MIQRELLCKKRQSKREERSKPPEYLRNEKETFAAIVTVAIPNRHYPTQQLKGPG
jgi:hypothetical protein